MKDKIALPAPLPYECGKMQLLTEEKCPDCERH